MAPRKKKAKGTEKIYVGVAKQITVGFPVPGQRQPAFFTFWPERVNTVPADIWGVMLAKKSSPDERTGAEVAGPVEQYQRAGWLWTMTTEQALQIHEGGVPLVSPAGPNAGASSYTPPDPKREGITETQQQMESGMQSSDPSLNQIDMGEIPVNEIKPPPAPVVA